MTARFLPFAFVELVSPYNKKNITRWLEDMNFMFLPLKHKIHIFSPPCNILYLCHMLKIHYQALLGQNVLKPLEPLCLLWEFVHNKIYNLHFQSKA